MIYKPLQGSLADKIKIEKLESDIDTQKQEHDELKNAFDSVLTDVLPNLVAMSQEENP